MEIKFTKHAEKQLIERNISKEAVHDTILRPGQLTSQQDGILLFQSVYYEGDNKYLLRVAVKPQAGAWLILTAYRTSKVQKYWRDDL